MSTPGPITCSLRKPIDSPISAPAELLNGRAQEVTDIVRERCVHSGSHGGPIVSLCLCKILQALTPSIVLWFNLFHSLVSLSFVKYCVWNKSSRKNKQTNKQSMLKR